MVLSFHYRQGESILHLSQPVVKIAVYLLINLLLSLSSGLAVIILFALLLLFAIVMNPEIMTLAKELRGFVWIFIISYVSRAHLNGGETIVLFPHTLALSLSWNVDGARAAGLFILQMIAAIITIDLLMSSTKIGDLQYGIYQFFGMFHKGFAWRISIMIRLMLASTVVLMDSASRARKTLAARGLLPRKKPLIYLKGMGIAMIRASDYLSRTYTKAVLARGWSAPTVPARPSIQASIQSPAHPKSPQSSSANPASIFAGLSPADLRLLLCATVAVISGTAASIFL